MWLYLHYCYSLSNDYITCAVYDVISVGSFVDLTVTVTEDIMLIPCLIYINVILLRLIL